MTRNKKQTSDFMADVITLFDCLDDFLFEGKVRHEFGPGLRQVLEDCHEWLRGLFLRSVEFHQLIKSFLH